MHRRIRALFFFCRCTFTAFRIGEKIDHQDKMRTAYCCFVFSEKIELLRFKAEMVRVRMKLGWPVRVRERVDDRLWTPLSKADVMK